MKKMRKMKKASSIIAIVILIISILSICFFENVTKVVSRTNSGEKSDAGLVDFDVTGLVKSGTLENFADNMPLGTIFFDKDKADTTLVGENGYELNTFGNQYIEKRLIKEPSGDEKKSRVTYLGPNGNGIPAGTQGYITNTGIDQNASESDRTKFTMKFDDVVTMQDTTTRDVLITISNIYIWNQRTDNITFWVGWRGNGLAVYPLKGNENQQSDVEEEENKGMAMHCDISISVINEDGTPVKGEKLLLEVKDLDVSDKTRLDSKPQNAFPKAHDTFYNEGLTEEQKLALYDSDYRESIYILKGAVSDAYMPETNWNEVIRLADGENANGLRFLAYTEDQDESTLNTGFRVLVDSEESTYRWYGSTSRGIMGTTLFTNSANHRIKATSSEGGKICNWITYNDSTIGTIIADSDNYTGRTYQHNFADGTTVNYNMTANANYYMEKITIDNVEFLPSDFSVVTNGQQDKEVTITKGQKQYKFKVTKDSNGKITNALYIFEKNNANHEISVVWKTDPITTAQYTVRYLEKGTNQKLHEPKTAEAEIESTITATSEKIEIEGYTYDSSDKASIIIDEDSTKNIITLYYTKNPTEAQYTVRYLEKGTNQKLHDPKTDDATIGSTITATSEKISIEGYTYDSSDKASITIDEDSTKNIITLYYTKNPTEAQYTVRYLEKGTNQKLHDPKTDDATIGSTITATSEKITIDGYTYDSSDKSSITINEDSTNNIITLYYTKNPTEAQYTVRYLDRDTNEPVHTEKKDEATIGNTITAESEKITVANYTYDGSDKTNITIDEDSTKNIITLYYKKDKEPEPEKSQYTIKYVDKDTNEEIHDQKIEDADIDKVIKAEDERITIENYTYDSSDKDSVTISEDKDKNIITLYYVKNEEPKTGKVIVKYVDEDTGKEIAESETITGNVNEQYTSSSKTIDGYDLSKNSGNTKGKISEKDTTVVYYYKAKVKETVPAKEDKVKTLPKTGNANIFTIAIVLVALLGMIFAIRYFKLRDIK